MGSNSSLRTTTDTLFAGISVTLSNSSPFTLATVHTSSSDRSPPERITTAQRPIACLLARSARSWLTPRFGEYRLRKGGITPQFEQYAASLRPTMMFGSEAP